MLSYDAAAFLALLCTPPGSHGVINCVAILVFFVCLRDCCFGEQCLAERAPADPRMLLGSIVRLRFSEANMGFLRCQLFEVWAF